MASMCQNIAAEPQEKYPWRFGRGIRMEKKSCESASVREGPEFGVTLDGWWAEVTPREDMGGMLMKVTVGVMAGRGRERWGRGKGRGVIAR